MKIKVSEAQGKVLDWMVAKCEGFIKVSIWPTHVSVCKKHSFEDQLVWAPSTDWAQCGPIIDREGITVGPHSTSPAIAHYGPVEPLSSCPWSDRYVGPTMLIAAMRCFVVSKLGGTVDVPEGLL